MPYHQSKSSYAPDGVYNHDTSCHLLKHQSKRAEVINVEDENMLWDKNLGVVTPEQLYVIWHFT